MKIKEIGNLTTTISEYLHLNGIEDVELYLNPTNECFEDVGNYVGMADGYEMLMNVLKEGDNNAV